MNPNSDHLSEVPNNQGLRVDKRRVRFSGSDRKLRALPHPLEKGESRVLTQNPNIIATQAYKKTSPILRLANNPGSPIIEIDVSPNSFAPNFIIPKLADVVWVLAVPPEERGAESRWRPWSEIHVYDFSGKKVRSLPPQDVGKIRMARPTESGDLVAAQWIANDKMRLVRFTASGAIAEAFAIPFRHVENMAVFNNGSLISLQTYSSKENKRYATLYRRDGSVVAEFSVEVPQTALIPAVTPGGNHFLITRSDPQGLWGEIRDSKGAIATGNKVPFPFSPAEAAIPDNLDFIVLRSLPSGPPAPGEFAIAILDNAGRLLVDAKCASATPSRESQIELFPGGARWLCGDEWVGVEVAGASK